MGLRLERLEQGMMKLQGSLDKLLTERSLGPYNASWVQTMPGFDNTSLLSSASLEEATGRSVGLGAFRAVADSEMYAGPITIHCLAIDAKELILEPAIRSGSLNQHDAASLTDRLDNLLTSQQKNVQENHDTEPLLSMPPTAMLETMIEPYFDHLNPTFPIWTRQRFRNEINNYQTGNASYAVAANNIILLTLTAKFVRTMSRTELVNSNEDTFPSIEVELIKPFVTNARRAAEQMGRLSSPTLSNVQALLSLCLVCQYYCPRGTLYQLYHQAIYLSRLIGLGGPMPLSNDTNEVSESYLQERCNVFRCLCILGPSVSWATGTLAVNLMFDQAPTATFRDTNSSDTQSLDWKSELELSQIRERAFRHLAIPATESKPQIEVLSGAGELLVELEEWHRRYSSNVSVEKGQEIAEEPVRRFEIDITSYYFLRLMLLLSKRGDPESSQEVVNASRDLIQAFDSQWRTASNLGYYAYLTRNIALFTPVAMIQIIVALQKSGTDTNHNFAEDLELLRSFRRMSHTITRLSQADSHAMHQATLIDILLDLAVSCVLAPQQPIVQVSAGVQLDYEIESFSSSLSDTAIAADADTAQAESANTSTRLQKPSNQASYGSLSFTGFGDAEVEHFGDHGIDSYQDIVNNTWWETAVP
ncbi:hypothetical protein F5Y10DRAFT_294143 [Nemania abortiva]|nr:hypothetical protein F5Y10DRAFT_294143 [Nemania abortiva]